MNQVFAGGLALIIALILWSSKKQSKASAFFKSQKDSFSKAEVTTSELIIDKSLQNQKSTTLKILKPKMKKKNLKKKLFKKKKKNIYLSYQRKNP